LSEVRTVVRTRGPKAAAPRVPRTRAAPCRFSRYRAPPGTSARASPKLTVCVETSSPVGGERGGLPPKEGYVPDGAGSPGRKGPAVRAKADRASTREGATRVHRVRSLRPRKRRWENSSPEWGASVAARPKHLLSRSRRAPGRDVAPVSVCSRTTLTGASSGDRRRRQLAPRPDRRPPGGGCAFPRAASARPARARRSGLAPPRPDRRARPPRRRRGGT
jgi:hypothetical protein